MESVNIGKLYLCATPIGNLEDMPVRAIRVMKEADVIAAEDTRNSVKLINHFEIDTPMTSYHEFNKYDKARILVLTVFPPSNGISCFSSNTGSYNIG